MHRGFWDDLTLPIIGLSPMDGVTDATYRFMVAVLGKPQVQITEFVSVEGMNVGNPEKMFVPFKYDEIERPIVAQVFGTDVEAFYQAAIMVAHLGFDGVDINMGCPARNISARGAGASLIRTPQLAKEIIRAVRKGCEDYANGKKVSDLAVPQRTKDFLYTRNGERETRKLLPVSVKTRIGYDTIVVEEWMKHLLEEEPANISLHGRTLEQMYTGLANWEAIGIAAKVVCQTKTTLLGNGDIKSLADAHEKITRYGVNGVLVGRATFGNPWLFTGQEPSLAEKMKIAIAHAKKYEEIAGTEFFHPMRKHLGWYMHGFDGARDLRVQLLKTNSAQEVEELLLPYLNS